MADEDVVRRERPLSNRAAIISAIIASVLLILTLIGWQTDRAYYLDAAKRRLNQFTAPPTTGQEGVPVTEIGQDGVLVGDQTESAYVGVFGRKAVTGRETEPLVICSGDSFFAIVLVPVILSKVAQVKRDATAFEIASARKLCARAGSRLGGNPGGNSPLGKGNPAGGTAVGKGNPPDSGITNPTDPGGANPADPGSTNP